MPSETRARRGQRTLLSDATSFDQDGRITGGVGIAGVSTRTNRNATGVCEEPPYGRRIPIRDEPAAGEPAPCRSSDRTAKHYRLPQVEKPHGGIQSWNPAGGLDRGRGRGERVPRSGNAGQSYLTSRIPGTADRDTRLVEPLHGL